MELILSDIAIERLRDIVDYYSFHASKSVALKIRAGINRRIQTLLLNQRTGQKEPSLAHHNQDYRYLVEGHYKIVYRLAGNILYIVDIFDTRQHPGKMNG